MMDLNKHIVKNDNNKPFHSNGFAQIANGNRVGSVDNTSFSQRQQIENNRRLVNSYNRSVIGNSRGISRPRPVVSDQSNVTIGLSPRQRGSTPTLHPISRFSEPPARSYNPFA